MILSIEERKRLQDLMERFDENKLVQSMKNYSHHGIVSTYDHSEHVTVVSFIMAKKLGWRVDEEALIEGAFLHDFYLYDWHVPDKSHSLHGFSHAEVARENAVREFHISKKAQKMIASHMWPLNITQIPISKEGVILCLADKFCSIMEIVGQRVGGINYRFCR